MPNKRLAAFLLVLCAGLFACFLHFGSPSARSASGAIQSPFGTSGETAYDAEESLAGDQGFVLVDRYGGQQGGGLNSLVSLQVK